MATLFAITARSNREKYAAATQPDLDERARINAQPFTPAARMELLAPVEARIKARFSDARVKLLSLQQGAAERFNANRPAAIQRREAFAKPERANAVRVLAADASPDELIALAKLANESKDSAAGFGIRLALNASTATFSEEQRAAIHAELDRVVGDQTEQALADLVGTQVELGQFDAAGPYVDGGANLLADPVAAMRRADAAGTIPREDGSVQSLSGAEVARLCEIAGVPQGRAA